jgi:hypothetical protein
MERAAQKTFLGIKEEGKDMHMYIKIRVIQRNGHNGFVVQTSKTGKRWVDYESYDSEGPALASAEQLFEVQKRLQAGPIVLKEWDIETIIASKS